MDDIAEEDHNEVEFTCPYCDNLGSLRNHQNVEQHIRARHKTEKRTTFREMADAAKNDGMRKLNLRCKRMRSWKRKVKTQVPNALKSHLNWTKVENTDMIQETNF